MANPFDDIVQVDNKSTNHKRETPRKRDEITFSINKRFMERAAFVIIILVLGGLLLFNPWNSCSEEANITANVVKEQEVVEETKVEVESVTEKVEEKEPEVEEEPEEEVEEEEDKPISGNLVLSIKDVDYAENEQGDPLKIEKLTFTISNKWKTFSPRIEVYMYDTFAPVEISEKIRVNKVLGTAAVGKSYTYSVLADEFAMKYFYPDDDMEVILVKLFDRTSGEQLTYTKMNIP